MEFWRLKKLWKLGMKKRVGDIKKRLVIYPSVDSRSILKKPAPERYDLHILVMLWLCYDLHVCLLDLCLHLLARFGFLFGLM
ncbi:hypothetical protein L6452_17198 [Arctium lappa]|uniref:Uncharacterized protein n=1 Tax=Arctium lappa TaxID=4217 RepID=A0ACB9C2X0_ARCLA|nr:hypothetical protein L6452_17198 [Arctium lappa]